MPRLKRGDDSGTQSGKNDKAPQPNGLPIGDRKSIFGWHTELDMLSWIKEVALDPCDAKMSRDSHRRLWNQSLRVRKVMLLNNAEFPRRKRKLKEFVKGKLSAALGLPSENNNQQHSKKVNRVQFSHVSSGSCLVNSVGLVNSAGSVESSDKKVLPNSHSSGSLLTVENNFRGKKVSAGFSVPESTTNWGPPRRNTLIIIDSDESVNGSNTPSPTNTNVRDHPFVDIDDSVLSSNSSSSEEPPTNRRSKRLLNFIGDHLQRMVVPVGPRFQAEVPDWAGPPTMDNIYHDGGLENSKWLGTRTWPMETRTEHSSPRSSIGKGRADTCSCESRGSSDCTEIHILEERHRLECELGRAFFSWKFDEMGEIVSLTWALSEEKSFESLVKGKHFWKNASKHFPAKSRENLVGYYFNVYIPRRSGTRIKPALKRVNSDDEEEDEEEATLGDFQRSIKARGNILSSSNHVKCKFLRTPR